MAITTHFRVREWQSDVTLWTAAHKLAPLKVRPAVNLAAAYLADGDTDRAWLWAIYAQHLSANPTRPDHERTHGRALAFLEQGLIANAQHDPITTCLAFHAASQVDPTLLYTTQLLLWASCV